MSIKRKFRLYTDRLLGSFSGGTSPEHYATLRRTITMTMLLVTTLPLFTMIVINHFQYRNHLRNEIITPLNNLAGKTRHSFDLFLEERLSTVRFIANAYSYEELNNQKTLNKVFRVLKKELGGFVDLGVIDAGGKLVSYAGPYALLGKNYASQQSFQEVLIKGKYISNVFMGHRKIPHIVIAVQNLSDEGSWILRATIDADRFDEIIDRVGLSAKSDIFLVSRDNILQTDSKYYGKTLDKSPFTIPIGAHGTYVAETEDPSGRKIILACARFTNADYTLVIVKSRSVVLKSFNAFKADSLMVFAVGFVLIVLTVLKLTELLVERIRESDEKRENALSELQHSQKLSSIGRLAAGVAHEINNPLAIINEKAGLMNDLIAFSGEFNHKEKFGTLTGSIIGSVSRCKTITHRLLGFAKRLEILIEPLDINHVITEVLGFLEREAIYRKIDIRLRVSDSLGSIESDKGQLQQVFLNLLTNSFAAVDDGGIITIGTRQREKGGVVVEIGDNGCGMDEGTMKHIFDPFFSTKKGAGTGLGLSITYGIIEKLGGHIHVASNKGEGAVFTVELPDKPGTVDKLLEREEPEE